MEIRTKNMLDVEEQKKCFKAHMLNKIKKLKPKMKKNTREVLTSILEQGNYPLIHGRFKLYLRREKRLSQEEVTRIMKVYSAAMSELVEVKNRRLSKKKRLALKKTSNPDSDPNEPQECNDSPKELEQEEKPILNCVEKIRKEAEEKQNSIVVPKLVSSSTKARMISKLKKQNLSNTIINKMVKREVIKAKIAIARALRDRERIMEEAQKRMAKVEAKVLKQRKIQRMRQQRKMRAKLLGSTESLDDEE